MRLLLVLFLLVLLLAFVVGLFWPRRSRKGQERVKNETARTAEVVESRGGPVGEWSANKVRNAGRATQAAAHAGRRAHDEMIDSYEGSEQDRILDSRYGEGGAEGHGPAEPETDARRDAGEPS